jgi:hypothetical protein
MEERRNETGSLLSDKLMLPSIVALHDIVYL